LSMFPLTIDHPLLLPGKNYCIWSVTILAGGNISDSSLGSSHSFIDRIICWHAR
jgi:hypothetical protein